MRCWNKQTIWVFSAADQWRQTKAVVTAVRNFDDDDTFANKLEEIARHPMPNFQLGKLDGTLAGIFENNVDKVNDPFADLDHDTVGETS